MIYLDNNATTAVAPEAIEAMLPWLKEGYGNPSAGYRFGKASRRAVEEAREEVAALVGAADPAEIVFTSGGTESIHTAIRSSLSVRPQARRLLASAVEHSAVYEPFQSLGERGYAIDLCPVDAAGRLDLDAWRRSLAADGLALAALIWANNETGVLSPVAEAAEAAAEAGVPLHCDAVQAVGKSPVEARALPIQSLSISAHKFHGPKGVGALYLNRRSHFEPQILGGGQEAGRRSGTENLPGIVGMGVAARLARERLEADPAQAATAALRDRFEARVLAAVPDAEINGEPAGRLPNTSNLLFPGIDGEGLLILLDEAGVCCSPGSACSTGSVQPSRVLLAMGRSRSQARGSVRFSLSRFTTETEIDEAAAAVVAAAKKLRVVFGSGTSGRVVGGRS